MIIFYLYFFLLSSFFNTTFPYLLFLFIDLWHFISFSFFTLEKFHFLRLSFFLASLLHPPPSSTKILFVLFQWNFSFIAERWKWWGSRLHVILNNEELFWMRSLWYFVEIMRNKIANGSFGHIQTFITNSSIAMVLNKFF